MWTEMEVSSKDASVILRYSREGKGGEASRLIACSY